MERRYKNKKANEYRIDLFENCDFVNLKSFLYGISDFFVFFISIAGANFLVKYFSFKAILIILYFVVFYCGYILIKNIALRLKNVDINPIMIIIKEDVIQLKYPNLSNSLIKSWKKDIVINKEKVRIFKLKSNIQFNDKNEINLNCMQKIYIETDSEKYEFKYISPDCEPLLNICAISHLIPNFELYLDTNSSELQTVAELFIKNEEKVIDFILNNKIEFKYEKTIYSIIHSLLFWFLLLCWIILSLLCWILKNY